MPNVSTVISAEVFGNAGASAETWSLVRLTQASGFATMATAAINTEDTTISFELIRTDAWLYTIKTTSLDTGDRIYGAMIAYTL